MAHSWRAENKTRLMNLGAIEALANMMVKCPLDAMTQKKACGTMMQLAALPGAFGEERTSGLTGFVLDECAMFCLRSAHSVAECRGRIVEAGVIQSTAKVLENHMDDSVAVDVAASLLMRLSADEGDDFALAEHTNVDLLTISQNMRR